MSTGAQKLFDGAGRAGAPPLDHAMRTPTYHVFEDPSARARGAVVGSAAPRPLDSGLRSIGGAASPESNTGITLNQNMVIERSACKRFRPNSAMETPTFVIGEKFVRCDCCDDWSIGLDVRKHVRESKKHLRALDDYEPVPGTLTVVQAEALLEPRKTEGKKRRRRRFRREKRAAAPSPAHAEPSTSGP